MNTCWNKWSKLAQIRGSEMHCRELTRKKNGTYFLGKQSEPGFMRLLGSMGWGKGNGYFGTNRAHFCYQRLEIASGDRKLREKRTIGAI